LNADEWSSASRTRTHARAHHAHTYELVCTHIHTGTHSRTNLRNHPPTNSLTHPHACTCTHALLPPRVAWRGKLLAQQQVATMTYFPSVDSVVFTQAFPDGVAHTSTGPPPPQQPQPQPGAAAAAASSSLACTLQNNTDYHGNDIRWVSVFTHARTHTHTHTHTQRIKHTNTSMHTHFFLAPPRALAACITTMCVRLSQKVHFKRDGRWSVLRGVRRGAIVRCLFSHGICRQGKVVGGSVLPQALCSPVITI
jgi:hypothetical protein